MSLWLSPVFTPTHIQQCLLGSAEEFSRGAGSHSDTCHPSFLLVGESLSFKWVVLRLFDRSQPGWALRKKNHSFLGMAVGYESRKSSLRARPSSTWLPSAQCAAGGSSSTRRGVEGSTPRRTASDTQCGNLFSPCLEENGGRVLLGGTPNRISSLAY